MPANQRTGQINTGRLLREIWLRGNISRIELAQKLSLDKSTVTVLVNKLMKKGIIETRSEGQASVRGGRKPQYLGICRNFGYSLGLEWQPDKIRVILLDMLGEIREKRTLPCPLMKKNGIFPLVSVVREIYNSFSSYPLLGIGMALSGIVDPFQGRVLQSILLDIDSPLMLAAELKKRIPCEIMIENDANACAWGELLEARKKSLMNILFILMESDFLRGKSRGSGRFSLGMGLALDGKVFHGRQFSSGEYRSPQWAHDKKSQFSLSLKQLARLSEDGDTRRKLFTEIARNMAFLTNVLNINHIYAGGDIEPFWHELKPLLENEIQRNWSYPDRVNCECSLSTKGDFAAPFGAASMLLERIFTTGHGPFFQDHGLKIGLDVLEDSSQAANI